MKSYLSVSMFLVIYGLFMQASIGQISCIYHPIYKQEVIAIKFQDVSGNILKEFNLGEENPFNNAPFPVLTVNIWGNKTYDVRGANISALIHGQSSRQRYAKTEGVNAFQMKSQYSMSASGNDFIVVTYELLIGEESGRIIAVDGAFVVLDKFGNELCRKTGLGVNLQTPSITENGEFVVITYGLSDHALPVLDYGFIIISTNNCSEVYSESSEDYTVSTICLGDIVLVIHGIGGTIKERRYYYMPQHRIAYYRDFLPSEYPCISTSMGQPPVPGIHCQTIPMLYFDKDFSSKTY